ncbi:MAG TPA: hypothetical protein VF813_02595, partial [Anaerolineaceae bacterium]
MTRHRLLNIILSLFIATSFVLGGSGVVSAQGNKPPSGNGNGNGQGNQQQRSTTQAMRQAARMSQPKQKTGVSATYAGINPATAAYSPLASKSSSISPMGTGISSLASMSSIIDYFGVANYANSQLPQLTTSGAVTTGTGMRKFVDSLPGLCSVSGPNDLGQCIPVGVADTTTFPGSDYY